MSINIVKGFTYVVTLLFFVTAVISENPKFLNEKLSIGKFSDEVGGSLLTVVNKDTVDNKLFSEQDEDEIGEKKEVTEIKKILNIQPKPDIVHKIVHISTEPLVKYASENINTGKKDENKNIAEEKRETPVSNLDTLKNITSKLENLKSIAHSVTNIDIPKINTKNQTKKKKEAKPQSKKIINRLLNITTITNEIKEPIIKPKLVAKPEPKVLSKPFNITTKTIEIKESTLKSETVVKLEPVAKPAPKVLSKQVSKVDLPILETPTNNITSLRSRSISPIRSIPIVLAQSEPNCTLPNTTALHAHYGESKILYRNDTISIIFVGFIILLVRLIFSLIKVDKDDFFVESIKNLINQVFTFLIIVSFIQILYSSGYLDKFEENWQYFISGLFIFAIIWFVFNTFVIMFCTWIYNKWTDLEANAKSFEYLKVQYDIRLSQITQNFGASLDTEKLVNYFKDIFELYEYLITKTYFIVPLFPVYRSTLLRKDFNFAMYLKTCLLDTLNSFFKFSVACWFVTIVSLSLWRTLNPYFSVPSLIALLSLLPLLGLIISASIYYYLSNVVYRRIVRPISHDNYSHFQDFTPHTQTKALDAMYHGPEYIENITMNTENVVISNCNFHSNFQRRTPSFYEDTIIFGSIGFHVLLNFLQAISVSFLQLQIIIFVNKFNTITEYYSLGTTLGIFIPLLIIYFSLYTFVISLNLKWHAVLSKIEMKRNDSHIKSVIDKQINKASDMAESIYRQFKIIFLQYKISQNAKVYGENEDGYVLENAKLGRKQMQMLVDLSIRRFKFIEDNVVDNNCINDDNDQFSINIDDELLLFMKSSGCKLTKNDIYFMLHIINPKDGKLTKKHLYNIWAYIILFSETAPEEIFYSVIENYVNDNSGAEKIDNKGDKSLNKNKIHDMLMWFGDFLTTEQKTFILEEITEDLGDTFSLDAFVFTITALRRYNCN